MPELTQKEIELVAKLKPKVSDIIKDEFSLMDSNLVRWIRMQDGNVNKAEAAIKKHQLWRKENKADSLVTEKFCETVTTSYKTTIKGYDKGYRPLIYVQLGLMDAQKLTNDKLLEQWSRYMWSVTERVLVEIKHNQENYGLTECCGTEIIDLGGTTYNKCFNKQVFSQLLTNITTLDANYADVLDQIIIINAPSFVYQFFRVVKLILPQRVKRRIHVFGTDKSQWMPFLLELISEDQLSPLCIQEY